MTPNPLTPDTFTTVAPADLKPNERITRRKKLKIFLNLCINQKRADILLLSLEPPPLMVPKIKVILNPPL